MRNNMKEKIHPKSKMTKFKCATCGSEYSLLSTTKSELVSLDVCANCHPFYVGNSVDTVVKGRAEKLSSKFENKEQTSKKESKKSSKKIITDLDQLKA